jgi:hypothetical protein
VPADDGGSRGGLFDVRGGTPADEGVAGGGGTLVTPYQRAVCWSEQLRRSGGPAPDIPRAALERAGVEHSALGVLAVRA